MTWTQTYRRYRPRVFARQQALGLQVATPGRFGRLGRRLGGFLHSRLNGTQLRLSGGVIVHVYT